MTTPPPSIDISKRKSDARLVRAGGKLRHKVFADSPAGSTLCWRCARRKPTAWRWAAPKPSGGHAQSTSPSSAPRARGLLGSHLDSDPGRRGQRDLRLSVPGAGEATAAKLLSEIMEVKVYGSAGQLAACAGLAPRLHESGGSVRRKARLSKAGAPRLRKALYSPAVVAIRHSPYIGELSERLRARGKCPMQVIGAAMRKLVHLADGVLKMGRPFDPEMKTA